MSPKTFLGFGAVTAVVVIAAGVSISARYGAATSGVAEESVFAGLSGQFEDIGEIAVQDKDKTLTIKRAGDAWLVSDRSAYPAGGYPWPRIEAAVVSLRELVKINSQDDSTEHLGRAVVLAAGVVIRPAEDLQSTDPIIIAAN